ncbi:transcript variant X1 [Nothobranchius furzeri]|uniref:Transcript variant X1 n=1 Tax=Nothobranchius furzeri TaxID=105023 RepID=A0A9D2Y8G5_NOTFU|nr:transcript variant X1 [Nothobranchius furzeri]
MMFVDKTTSSSVTIDENKKKTTLLKDNSWIKRADYEDEPVDDDPNFGKSLLHHSKTGQTVVSSSTDPDPVKSTKPESSSTSVHALSRRFGVPLDESKTSSSTKTSTSYTRRYTSGITDPPSMTTTTVTEDPKTSTKTTTVTKNGTTTETTIQNTKSSVITSPTKTETFSERVKSSSKGAQLPPYSPTKTTTTTKVTSTKEVVDKPLDSALQSSLKDEDLTNLDNIPSFTTTGTVMVKNSSDAIAEDNLYDTLIPSSIRDGDSNSSTVTTTRTVTVKSSPDSFVGDKLYDSLIPTSAKDDAMNSSTKMTSSQTVTVTSTAKEKTKTTTTTKTSFDSMDESYGSFLSKTITSDVSSPIRSQSPVLSTPTSTRSLSYSSYTDDIPSPRTGSYSDSYSKTYSYSRPDTSYEYTSITSPSLYSSSSYKSNRLSDDSLADPIYTKSSTKSVYQSERPLLEKDLCTSCRKPFTGDAKMILDDMKINCHATCFKCDVCNSSLSNMKAGDSMWIYKRTVHCENCFEATRDKWRR